MFIYIMRRSADLESSTQMNSNSVMRHHMLHHVHVDSTNKSAGLRRLLMAGNVLLRVMLLKVQMGLYLVSDFSMLCLHTVTSG